jgi:hypothetical protein
MVPTSGWGGGVRVRDHRRQSPQRDCPPLWRRDDEIVMVLTSGFAGGVRVRDRRRRPPQRVRPPLWRRGWGGFAAHTAAQPTLPTQKSCQNGESIEAWSMLSFVFCLFFNRWALSPRLVHEESDKTV